MTLKDRAAQAAGNSTEVAERPAQVTERPMTVYDLIEKQRPALARALPAHLDADRLARIAVTVVKSTPGLEDCTVDSLLGGLMTCAQLGLEPGPLGEAYLLPFNNKIKASRGVSEHWEKRAQLIIGYRGMIKLAWQSGQMHSIQAYSVYAQDRFKYAYGLEPTIEHVPYDGAEDPGELTHAYAVAKFKDGGVASVVLNRRQIDALRARSKTSDFGPWVSDYDAMARKTAVRQLSRWLPQSPQLQQFHQAAARDESLRTDWQVSLAESQPSFPPQIESVGHSSSGQTITEDGQPLDDAAAVAAAERAEAEAYEREQEAARAAGGES